MGKYRMFSYGDRVRVVRNLRGYEELPIGATGTVKKIMDGGEKHESFLQLKWDDDCGISEKRQGEYWIETRFDFAEDEHIEAPVSVGGLFE